jgi:hypothetical protein
VEATAAIRNIIVTWDNPAYVGHAHAEVWGSSTSLQADSVLLGMTPGAIYVDEVGPSVTRYYWVRFVNTNDTPGPYNALVGTSATTGSDVAYTLGLLAGQITTTELATTLNNRINLIDGPATTTGTIPNQLAFLQGQVDAITSYPDYDNGTTYDADDIVKYDGGLYKALSSTTGNLPTNATYWLKIGDYSSLADIVAAHTADISTLTTDLGGEVTARETLATQMRGSYSGTDLASVTSGLIFSERTARVSADEGLAGSISIVAATAAGKNRIFRQPTAPSSPSVNDVWVDTKISYSQDYFSEEYAVPKYKQFQWTGTEWLDITDTDISDNFAIITREQLARATADSALAQDILTLNTFVDTENATLRADLQIERTARIENDEATVDLVETLDAQVNNATTGLPVTRATLINDYSTTATVNSAIASSKTALRAYTDVSASRTFRQTSAPTKRGVDVDTALDIPLQTGDVWVDTDDQNKLYQWSGAAWVYSPDGAITGSVTALAATLDTEYLTATDTQNAIAQSSTFLRAYADIQSKVFRTADAPTKRGVDPETGADILLLAGDVWYDTNDSNKLYLWSGSAWVYSPDAVITGSVTAVDARVTTVETTQIGYCTIGGVASDNTNKAACEAAGGTWNVGIPIATAVKQVSVSDGADSATLEQRFTAQKTLNDGLQAQYTIKLDVNGNVAGYGVYADSTGSSEFIANVNRFAVTTPQSSIQVRAASTTYAQGAIARVAGQDSKTLVCKIGGSTGAGSIVVGNIGTLVVDGSVTWQVASRVPFAVQAVPTSINGQPVPAGVYIDAAYVLNATIQNAQIADLAIDNQKIVDLDVGKLRAGSIDVGSYIQSTSYIAGTQGWRIHGNGFAEFGAAAIRGQLTAAQIDSRGLTIRTASGDVILNAGSTIAASTFIGNVTGTVAGTAASTVVSTANSALSTANAASANATTALAKLTDIASDNLLTPGEKPTVIADYGVITSEQAGIDAQAGSYGITTQRTAYNNAVAALTTYLGMVALNGAGGTLLVRVPVLNDNINELDETFTLTAISTSGTASVGTATIVDDGNGTIFNDNGTENTTAPKDNDAIALTVTSPTVNEASPYAVFTVGGILNQLVSLTLTAGTATPGAGNDYIASMEVSTNGGTTWTAYTTGNVALAGTGGTLLVRVPVLNDDIYESNETFTLTATSTSGAASVGTATIVDDDNSTIFNDNDIALTVTSPTVNEASPYAVFTVDGEPGQLVSLSLGAGTATPGAGNDYIASMEVSIDSGTTWTPYASGTLTTPVVWNNLSGNTIIVGTTFRSTFSTVYTARQALLDAIAARAKVLADTAQGTANSALSGLTTKLNSDAQNVLAGAGGLSVGTLAWNSSGVRTGGYGVGFSANGLAAYNSAGAATFVLDGSTGDATFAGTLAANTVNTINLVVGAVTAANAAVLGSAIFFPTSSQSAASINGPSVTITTSGGAGTYLLLVVTGLFSAQGIKTTADRMYVSQFVSIDGGLVVSSPIDIPLLYQAVSNVGMTGDAPISIARRITGLSAGPHTITTSFTALPGDQNGGLNATGNWNSGGSISLFAVSIVAVENKV